MGIDSTIPIFQPEGAVQYPTQSPTSAGTPGVIVPPSVLPMLMTTSTALAPKPSSPPPHPQISMPLTAIQLGYQMAFNQLVSPTSYGNAIVAYRIYRNKTSNSFSGSQLIRTVAHDPTHQGSVTVQDSTGGNQTYYYFVTAVDSTRQESTQPGSFQASATTSGNANSAIGVTGASGTASSGASYTVIPEMTETLTCSGNPILVAFTCSFLIGSVMSGNIAVFKDGVQLSTDFPMQNLSSTGLSVLQSLTFTDVPSAGSHTYDIRWKGSLVANGNARTFQVVQLG